MTALTETYALLRSSVPDQEKRYTLRAVYDIFTAECEPDSLSPNTDAIAVQALDDIVQATADTVRHGSFKQADAMLAILQTASEAVVKVVNSDH